METISFDETEFWLLTGSLLIAGLSFFFLFTQIATAHLTFDADNRSTGIRVACSIQFFLYWLVFVGWQYLLGRSSLSSGDIDFIVTWSVLYVAVSGFFAATEPDFVSRRVRRGIPKTTLLRLLALPYLPGGHRGFVFLLLHLALIPLFVESLFVGTITSSHWEAWWTLTFLLYVVIYVGLGSAFGRALRRVSSEVRPMHVRVIIFILLAMGLIVPSLPLLFGPREYEWLSRMLRVSNPIEILRLMHGNPSNRDIANHEIIAIWSAAGLGLLLNVRPMWVGVMEVLRQPVVPTVTHTPKSALTPDS